MNNETKNRGFKFIVFDLDGVLVTPISSWVWVHDHFGVNNDDSYERYMRNEIDDSEFMRSDIALWLSKKKRIHINEIRGILASVQLMPGFHDTFKILKFLGIQVAIVSSGLNPLAERVSALAGIPPEYVLANGLETDENGYLTGEGILRVKLRAKGEPVHQLMAQLGFSRAETVAVGNGVTDIPMLKASGLGIAFNPLDDNVTQNANVVIFEKNLIEILKHICDVDGLPSHLREKCK